MRNPGGYGRLICDGPAIARDRFGRVIQAEHDTVTCGHCGSVVFINAGERAADIGGFCRACSQNICGPCVDADRCRPMEQWLEDYERAMARQEFRRAL